VRGAYTMTPALLLVEARAALEALKCGRHWMLYRAARPGGEQDVDELLSSIDRLQAPGAEPVLEDKADLIFRRAARQRELVVEFAFFRASKHH
jgi:hypothetical protein